MSHVFISYSRHDRDYARKLADSLLDRGFDVWIDDRIEYGENWERAVFTAARECTSFVVIMSPNSEQSAWVPRECAYAEKCGKSVYPLLLDGDVFPRYVQTQYADVRGGRLPPDSFYEQLGRQTSHKTTRGTEHHPPVEARMSQRNAPDYVVARIGPADFRSIGEAIQQAPEGSTILIKPGVYRESIKLEKRIELIGDGPREEIVIDSTQGNCIQMNTDYAVVRGLTLRQRSGPDERKNAAFIPQGCLVLEDCDLTSDSITCLLVMGRDSDPIVRRCRIYNGSSDGITLYDGGSGTFEDCEIFGHRSTGVDISNNATPIIRHCQIYQNRLCGVFVHGNGAGLLKSCDIYENDKGIIISDNSNLSIHDCTVTRNRRHGVYAYGDAKGTVTNCDLRGNGYGAWSIDKISQVTRRDNQE